MSSHGDPGGRPPTEEELRAAYEQQIKQLRVEDVLIQTVVSLLNLGARKAGLAPGTEDERDGEQLRIAIEGVRALLPLVEAEFGEEAGTVRAALSQLQMSYARLAGPGAPAGGGEQAAGAGAGAAEPQAEPTPGGPGPAQRSGRLWVPGQGGGPPPRG